MKIDLKKLSSRQSNIWLMVKIDSAGIHAGVRFPPRISSRARKGSGAAQSLPRRGGIWRDGDAYQWRGESVPRAAKRMFHETSTRQNVRVCFIFQAWTG